MKVCWDNLERFEGITNNGRLYTKPYKWRGTNIRKYYRIVEECAWCGEPFIADGGTREAVFCSRECHGMSQRPQLEGNRYGPIVVVEIVDYNPIRREHMWKCACDCGEVVIKGSRSLYKEVVYCSNQCGFNFKDIRGKRFGMVVAEEMVGKTSEGRSIWRFRCDCGKEFEAPSASFVRNTKPVRSCGCLALPFGFSLIDKELVSYELYSPQLECAEELDYDIIEKYDNFKLLKVKCSYCGSWFNPNFSETYRRIGALNGGVVGEHRFYCSKNCKLACPIYGRQKYARGHAPATSREVQPELRQMVLERDNWTCQYGSCGKTNKDAELHCHHFEGININPIESADLDMCITFCKKHHKLVHKQRDCRYFELTCNYYLTNNK